VAVVRLLSRQTFQRFCTNYNINLVSNAVATPRANGQCERFNRTILVALATSSAGKPDDKWDNVVKKKQVQSAINCTHNKSVGMTSMEVLVSYKSTTMAESNVLGEVQGELERLDLHKKCCQTVYRR
jgi:hypothetical protein